MNTQPEKPEPEQDMTKDAMCQLLKRIKDIADTACDTAQEAGVTGAINWGDLGCVEARMCLADDGSVSYDVLIEEAAPGSVELMQHVSEAVGKLGLAYPVEVRTEW